MDNRELTQIFPVYFISNLGYAEKIIPFKNDFSAILKTIFACPFKVAVGWIQRMFLVIDFWWSPHPILDLLSPISELEGDILGCGGMGGIDRSLSIDRNPYY